MNTEAALTHFEDWTLRLRSGTGKKMLLLLHGWTGDENSTSVFTRNLPSEYWIVAPRAPYPTLPNGFSWRAPAARGSWPTLDLFRPSIEKLVSLIDQLAAANKLDGTQIDVAGFSQGGALTFSFGLLHPDRVRRMGILAGFAPNGAEQVLSGDLLAGKKVFVAHGTLDEMVPIAMAQQAVQLLKRAGADVTFCESEVGHKLSVDCLRSFEKFLSN